MKPKHEIKLKINFVCLFENEQQHLSLEMLQNTEHKEIVPTLEGHVIVVSGWTQSKWDQNQG